jgi:hypothetical protein
MQDKNVKHSYKSFENVEMFKYLETAATNQNRFTTKLRVSIQGMLLSYLAQNLLWLLPRPMEGCSSDTNPKTR